MSFASIFISTHKGYAYIYQTDYGLVACDAVYCGLRPLSYKAVGYSWKTGIL